MAQTRSAVVPHGQTAKMDINHTMKNETLSLEKIHTENLPIVMLSVDKAAKAIKSGDEKTALAALLKAQKMLLAIHEAIGKHVKPRFVNNRCPIMGKSIEPERVKNYLIRDYMGQKVAFCCYGCPATWDNLTDAKKQAKLAEAKPESTQIHITHNH